MKRTLLKLFVLLTLLCAGCVAYGLLIEPKTLKIREFELISEKYKGPPVRIGVITDIHIGGLHVPAKRVETLVKNMNALEPDFVILPGDFVGTHRSIEDESKKFNAAIEEGINYLRGFDAPAFATLGNHDALYDRQVMAKLLVGAELTLLENSAKQVGKLCLVGLGDYKTSTAERAAFKSCHEASTPLVFTHYHKLGKAFAVIQFWQWQDTLMEGR